MNEVFQSNDNPHYGTTFMMYFNTLTKTKVWKPVMTTYYHH